MMSDQFKDSLIDKIIKGFIEEATECIKRALELLLNAEMKIER